MLHYNEQDQDRDVYDMHRGDGMCEILFYGEGYFNDIYNSYSYLDGAQTSFIQEPLKYMNNAYRTKSDII
jgi:hypothetical protein